VTAFTVWKFDTPGGAEDAAKLLEREAGEGMLHVPPRPRELQGKRRIHRPLRSIRGVLQLGDQLARLFHVEHRQRRAAMRAAAADGKVDGRQVLPRKFTHTWLKVNGAWQIIGGMCGADAPRS